MTDRRTLLTAAAAALAAPLAHPRAMAARPPASDGSEHSIPGGTRGIQRGQFTYTGTGRVENYDTIAIPDALHVFMIPLTQLVFDESDGAKYQLSGDGLVTIVKDDLYELTANMDWPAQPRGSGQDGYDVDMRKLMIQRVRVGVQPPRYQVGKVTRIGDSSLYDRLATHDMPGSNAPHAVRTSVRWGGTIPAGGMASIDVQLPVGSFTPAAGDFVRASHENMTDDALHELNVGLLVSARIVAPLLARVIIENRYNTQDVIIDEGDLNVLAESALTSGGNNGDSWCYLGSGPVLLLAGEKIFVTVRSSSPGDFLQIDNASFLRIANVVA
jgi:hypothetical protein